MVFRLENNKKMKANYYYNTDKETFENKTHNIFIATCLGNKFFLDKTHPTKNVVEYVDFALQYTKEKILILIPDTVQISNYVVRNSSRTEHQNLNYIRNLGRRIRTNIEEIIKRNFSTRIDQIKIINWDDYFNKDPYSARTTITLYKEIKNNTLFERKLMETVKATVTDRIFTEKQYSKLSEYILDEFSLIYSGLTWNKTNYDCLIYPYKDATLDFIFDIMSGKLFPELKQKLPIKKSSMVVVNK